MTVNFAHVATFDRHGNYPLVVARLASGHSFELLSLIDDGTKTPEKKEQIIADYLRSLHDLIGSK